LKSILFVAKPIRRQRSDAKLRTDSMLVDIFFLDIINSHERFNPFDDPLGVKNVVVPSRRRRPQAAPAAQSARAARL
jgi:hypothetical protein